MDCRTIPDHARFRPNTVDRDVWREVVEADCYRLPPHFAPGDWVLDLGAHTGAFSWRCANAGARVVAVECCRENFAALCENVRPVESMVTALCAAAWRSDEPVGTIDYQRNWMPANTGGGCTMLDAGTGGYPCVSVPLAALLALRQSWRMLKLDVEGAEFPILYTCLQALSGVREIVGEYHERDTLVPRCDTGRPARMADLAVALAGVGFSVEHFEVAPGGGYFFAKRQ